MDVDDAFLRLSRLEGSDLRTLADEYGIAVFREGRKRKGWAGLVVEACLGLPPNPRQAPNGETWELKLIPLIRNTRGGFRVKETMAITMIHPDKILSEEFEESHLLSKLRRMIVCVRMHESTREETSELIKVVRYDIDDHPEVRNQVRADFIEVKEAIRTRGFDSLTGSMGVLVQPRTKGRGHGSTTRAFYARTGFVKTIIDFDSIEI